MGYKRGQSAAGLETEKEMKRIGRNIKTEIQRMIENTNTRMKVIGNAKKGKKMIKNT